MKISTLVMVKPRLEMPMTGFARNACIFLDDVGKKKRSNKEIVWHPIVIKKGKR